MKLKTLAIASLTLFATTTFAAHVHVIPAEVRPSTEEIYFKIYSDSDAGKADEDREPMHFQSNGWCIWTKLSKLAALATKDGYAATVEESPDSERYVNFCDRVEMMAPNSFSFYQFLEERYPGCLEIKVDHDEKTVSLALGAKAIKAKTQSSNTLTVELRDDREEPVHTTTYEPSLKAFCAHDVRNAPKDDENNVGLIKLFEEYSVN